ncbi:hypothetical protein HDV04_001067 [Boothiomyces sp. JEL0838]|nr:hypothetical protein HDV04_001067 [Boothiomyces sp. JEL0838]
MVSPVFALVSLVLARGRGIHYKTNVDPDTHKHRGLHYKSTGEHGKRQASGAQLTYRGGPVISNIEVHPIFYGGDNVQYKSDIQGFYAGVVDSPYFDWLSEYNTQTQTIGRGKYVGSIDYTDNLASSLDDQNDIQPLLKKLADAGTIQPNANTYFPIHFQPNVDISQGGSASCQVFCAYHGTIEYKGGYIYYGVIPDQGGACSGGCGSDSNPFNNLCSVSSHEMIEATTDPAVGVAKGNAAPLGWYDSNNGEIGDICNAQQTTITGGNGNTYTVQLEWSNNQNSCIAQ